MCAIDRYQYLIVKAPAQMNFQSCWAPAVISVCVYKKALTLLVREVSVCMYACMHVFLYVCMYVYSMYARMHVCKYARMHVCMYECMHVCMSTSMCA